MVFAEANIGMIMTEISNNRKRDKRLIGEA